jgi:hypothetical protein
MSFIQMTKTTNIYTLFKYLTKEKDKLVEGEEFVKANELVEEINESRGGSPTPSNRGTYKIFSPKQRYEIGKYASEHGTYLFLSLGI